MTRTTTTTICVVCFLARIGGNVGTYEFILLYLSSTTFLRFIWLTAWRLIAKYELRECKPTSPHVRDSRPERVAIRRRTLAHNFLSWAVKVRKSIKSHVLQTQFITSIDRASISLQSRIFKPDLSSWIMKLSGGNILNKMLINGYFKPSCCCRFAVKFVSATF